MKELTEAHTRSLAAMTQSKELEDRAAAEKVS
jgi:hypothetical protein